MNPIMRVRGLGKSFGGIQAVKDVSFDLAAGSTLGFIGPNGAGKTTVFNLISGVTLPDRGEVLLDGQRVTRWPAHIRARHGIARTFQTMHLYRDLTARENVLMALHLHARYSMLAAILATPGVRRAEAALRTRAAQLLRRVGLEARADVKAGALSYGDQRRLDLCKALALEPRVLMLDEPAAGMNEEESRDLTALIAQLKAEHGLTVLIVEHHMDVVMSLSDEVVAMDFGEVIAHGPPDMVRRDARVLEAYLGQPAAEGEKA